ncbi:MAG: magnesium-translocating P-type ATPase [Candidatus Magasanikbacteria bacterium]|nr:magnesium-translocating P-type ATPase [Candidatus Magasanikbacteria bacterium]
MFNLFKTETHSFKKLLHASADTAKRPSNITPKIIEKLIKASQQEAKDLLKSHQSNLKGLRKGDVLRKRFKYGLNEAAKKSKSGWWLRLLGNFTDPLSALLLILVIISFLSKDLGATTMIALMVLLSVFLRFFQEAKADKAAEKLKAMVKTRAKVIRGGDKKEIDIKYLVPGDIIFLSAGDMIPADIRLLESKDLFINQATLTGEAIANEKHSQPEKNNSNPLDSTNLCFMGTNVESGTATALVISTGNYTYLGSLAKAMDTFESITSFDLGIKKVTWLIIGFIVIMVPLVFLLNGLSKGNWFEAFLFSLAVAVGLTPEMLPMIVTVNLSKGALDMYKKKAIVKHIPAIQNFGAMDILCTDKTGTITEGRVVLEKYLNIYGQEEKGVLNYAFLNSYYQTGLENLIDAAVLKHKELKKTLKISTDYEKIDEIPFDFSRRRMSVVVKKGHSKNNILICKGAVEEVLAASDKIHVGEKIFEQKDIENKFKTDIERRLNSEGFRVVAVAYKEVPNGHRHYSKKDETGLTLLGFLAFLDPPKQTAAAAISELNKFGIKIKILTGDNEIVTRNIVGQVGIPVEKIILGHDLDKMDDKELSLAVERTDVFAKLTPFHKEKITRALKANKHVVGFLGDGINDSHALRSADIGISVDSAADIAKESSDIILLEKNLLVLKDGVLEGRKIFGNIVKYIQMATSSNFGNMFSVVGGSIFLPFLPMLPIQVLTNNLLYDISQTSIPTDKIDPEYLLKPRQWRIDQIRRFMLFFGPISSLFDYLTYFVMLFVFQSWTNPALFHTGWFVESLVSQTLIIYVIRTNKVPFLQSWPSKTLIFTTLAVVAVGVLLPFSPLASTLGFVPLPPFYLLLLFVMIICYFLITQRVKVWFNKKYGWE